MKRLIKKSSGFTAYHGTSFGNFVNTINNGMLTPQGGAGDGPINPDMGGYNGRVFLATNINIAKAYAIGVSFYDAFAVVIEVDIDESQVLPDNQVTTSDDWKVSDYYFGQVSIEGNLPSSCFKNIYFYDSISEEEVFVAQVDNWEEKYLEFYTNKRK